MSNPHPLAARPTYTTAQLEQYFASLPANPPLTLASFQKCKANEPLAALHRLQLLTMAICPFGSLGIHYSTHHTLSLDTDAVYHKIVERRQGGYCMENNCFWSTVLRSLGYECYVVGARVSAAEAGVRGLPGDGFGGWGHEVVIVRIQGERYLSDVGFGGRGSQQPILLKEGETGKGMPGVTQRLAKRQIADWRFVGAGAAQGQEKLWVVDVPDERAPVDEVNGEQVSYPEVQAEKGWRPAYCFADTEWLPQDFEIINFRMCRDPTSMFVQNLILTKPMLDEKGEKCVGQVTLVKAEVSRKMYDKDGRPKEKELLVTCTSEEQRVKALEEWFGIKLKPEEVRAIEGFPTAIKG
ncbi:uncharacterized protein HMPREF1541_03079 [Cyphellophora europaea CBS 101466]|uniref:Uncharacterized protein n=1 Tax=Cyphellophora europaea (strain CBS 101466) TaxID=1220924 RepID=W2RZM4_CYPE1|nr:uncharacterized protein HMPREF1541_03079 [Cyphellophora europaea CBS 101466]ETN41144.1 hypothetical protein HMPREF1541_03079 [Cyphellophora europaea CBS 101466]